MRSVTLNCPDVCTPDPNFNIKANQAQSDRGTEGKRLVFSLSLPPDTIVKTVTETSATSPVVTFAPATVALERLSTLNRTCGEGTGRSLGRIHPTSLSLS
ncbi:Hypothetical protein SMAX5B_013032 [Scophthalmus maximus]|uniref:Uncharacterized protein n=1 Tax=Scophthalmus maximus TaxID=52904 RepID=A0A2U9BEJ0_SCOMX|nr:Hypothetical protein SMAX5B_013032 [Scophthalmus maximus]